MHSFFLRSSALLVSLTLASAASAGVIDVNQVGNSFDPQDIVINEGDTVTWHWSFGVHTVSEGTDGVVNGNEAFHSPLTAGTPTFSVIFDAAFLASNPRPGNRYDYFCEPHFLLGMVGSVTVCSPAPQTYCTASTTSIAGCVASISSTGVASIANPGAFQISSGTVPGGNIGLTYFSDKGRASIPFGTQGGLICVTPGFRSKPKLSGGTKNVCDGDYVFTLADLAATGSSIITSGNTINAAMWFRDPPSADGFGLTNGIEFTLCP